MIDDPAPGALPDDIEEFLITGQGLRAIQALMARWGITFDEAREVVARWLFEWQKTRKGGRPE
jgi:hypothetical protein